MDLNQDGLSDVISGSFPGELYFFRKTSDGSFDAGVQLRHRDGEPIKRGAASTVFAVDWDADDDLDLLVGNFNGKVDLVLNESHDGEIVFGDVVTLVSLAEREYGDTHPVAADWDGDGDLDLLVGHSEGGVIWWRNVGSRAEPELAEPLQLIPDSPSPWARDANRNPNDWGTRAKICVTDYNRDGRLDILLGDYCGRFSGSPDMTPAELIEIRAAPERLPQLRKQWAAAFRDYRSRLSANKGDDHDTQLTEILGQMLRLKQEIARYEELQTEFEPQSQSHGFVWLFLRRSP